MEGGQPFFPCHLQGPNHGDHHVLVDHGVRVQHNFPQLFPEHPYFDNVQPLITPVPAMQMQQDLTLSSLPVRVSNPSDVNSYCPAPALHHHGHLTPPPGPGHVLFGSPGMSILSSGARDTSVSVQTMTPNVTPPEIESGSSQWSSPPEPLFPPHAPLLPRRRRPRRTQPKPLLSQEEEEAKREKFLERNRAAAGKCRNKRKTWMSDLEDTKLELEERNARLRAEHSSLLNEISQVRALLMEHATCKDARIDKWVENEAKRFVFGADKQSESTLANVGMTNTAHSRHDSISSMSVYNVATTNEMRTPPHQRSLSLPQSSSPPQQGSVLMTPALPNTPMLYRNAAPYDHDSRPMIISHDSGYLTSSTMRMEETTVLNNFHEIQDSMLRYGHLVNQKPPQLGQAGLDMEMTGVW